MSTTSLKLLLDFSTTFYIKHSQSISLYFLDCPVPQNPKKVYHQINCEDDKLEKCLNSNKSYSSFEEAWKACGTVSGCDRINKQGPTNYYLRRASDPLKMHSMFWYVEYDCDIDTTAPLPGIV